jgi:GNAT superfamily N-acetyltransferase
MSCTSLTFRRPIPDDWERITAVLPDWCDRPDPSGVLSRATLEHFRTTSLLVEHEDLLLAFLVGSLCPDRADEACVHAVAVAPGWRRAGLGRDLYRRFCDLARSDGRTVVRAAATQSDGGAFAFHVALGFSILRGDVEIDGVPVATDHAPHGDQLVRFRLFLEPEAGA